MTDADLVKRLSKLEKESAESQQRFVRLEQDNARKEQLITELKSQLGNLNASEGSDEVRILKLQLAELASEKAALTKTVEALQADRIRPTPTQLIGSFRTAMNELRHGLAPTPGDRVAYIVSQFDVDLKAQIAVDKDTESIRFVLPEPGQEPPADTLSQIRFTFQTVPRPEVDDEEPFIVVPTLLQLSRDTALLALQRAGLELGTETSEPSYAAPGTVTAQTPDPGDEIPASETVDIIVAKPATVIVPDVVTMNLEDARSLLVVKNLGIGEITEQSSSMEEGTVIQQSIVAGKEVDTGTTIDLAVAVTEKVNVPAIVRLKVASAKQVLKTAGLVLGDQKLEPSTPNNAGLILSQSPEAETRVPLETEVSVIVGSVQRKRVPDVKKLSLKRAADLLEQNGFRVGKVTKKPGNIANDIVISQDPRPGILEASGTEVDLVVSIFKQDDSLIERVFNHPNYSKVGVSDSVLRKRMLKLGLNNAEKAKTQFSGTDENIKKKLAIPSLRGARELKKIIMEILDNPQ
jgi:beta-lactam-binding protein with PASTA domain